MISNKYELCIIKWVGHVNVVLITLGLEQSTLATNETTSNKIWNNTQRAKCLPPGSNFNKRSQLMRGNIINKIYDKLIFRPKQPHCKTASKNRSSQADVLDFVWGDDVKEDQLQMRGEALSPEIQSLAKELDVRLKAIYNDIIAYTGTWV